MRTVYKFLLQPGKTILEIPKSATFNHVATQQTSLPGGLVQEEPFIWVELDLLEPRVLRTIEVYRTGHRLFEKQGTRLEFIKSFLMEDDNCIFHVYERVVNS